MNSESTGDNSEYNAWLNNLSKMDDMSVSRELYNRIVYHSNIDKESIELFKLAYEYAVKLINQGKPLEPNLLRIYLRDIKGKDVNQINMINLIALLGICGIEFQKQNLDKTN